MKYNKTLLLTLLIGLMAFSASFAAQVIVSPRYALVDLGKGVKFEAQLFDVNYQPIAAEKYDWSVVPADLGKISDDGFFMAGRMPGIGEVRATAMVGGQRYVGSAFIVIGRLPQTDIRIEIKPSEAVVEPNGMQEFKVFAYSKAGVSLRMNGVRWFVQPPTLGAINVNGVFKAGPRMGKGKVIALVDIDNLFYPAEANVIVGLPATASIAGTVLNDGSNPIGGAKMHAIHLDEPTYHRSATTDDKGAYNFEKLIPGAYVVRAEADNYIPEFYDNVKYLAEATPIKVGENEAKTGIDFKLSLGGSISGQVLADNGVDQLEDAHVVAYLKTMPKIKQHALSDENGTYQITGLPTGSYVVMAEKGGYLIEFYDNKAKSQDADLVAVVEPNDTPNIDFTLSMTSAIVGVVTNEVDGAPIAGALVGVHSLKPMDGWYRNFPIAPGTPFVTKTNEKGEYAISLKPGIYYVYAYAEGFSPEIYDNTMDPTKATPVEVKEGHVQVDFKLSPMGSLSGKVVKEGTNEAIEGAIVQIFNERWSIKRHFKTKTDADGKYHFMGLPAGEYIVMAHAENYLPEYWQEASTVKEATPVNIENEKSVTDINFTLQAGAAIKGKVIDFATREPLARAIVSVYDQANHWKKAAMTDAEGMYVISGLPAGTYVVMAEKIGFYRQWYDDVDSEDLATPVVLGATEVKEDIDFALKQREFKSGAISGLVKDEVTELPVEGAHVFAIPLTFGTPKVVVTGPDGSYEISELKTGTYIVVAWAEGYVGEFYKDTQRWFKAERIPVQENQVTSGIDFDLTPREAGAYLIAGSIRGPKGEPVPGALVFAYEGENVVAATITDSDGNYTLEEMPAGEYVVGASSVSYEDSYYKGTSIENAEAVTVGSGENVTDASITLKSETTGVIQVSQLPNEFTLQQNYPNPFNPTTLIQFSLPSEAEVKLTVFNMLGKEIKTLFSGKAQSGSYMYTWDGNNDQNVNMPSGFYLYRLEASNGSEKFTQTRKMLLLK